jgi:hypothetical protein
MTFATIIGGVKWQLLIRCDMVVKLGHNLTRYSISTMTKMHMPILRRSTFTREDVH